MRKDVVELLVGLATLLVGAASIAFGIFGNTEVVANTIGQYGPGVDEGFATLFIVFGALLGAAGVVLMKR